MTSSTQNSFEKKVQRFQKIVHEMAKTLAKADNQNECVDWSSYLEKKFPESKELSAEKAAQLCAKRSDALSLHALQHLHAKVLLEKLEPYLCSLPLERSTYLRKALKFTLFRYLDGFETRFPSPSDAPQHMWKNFFTVAKELRFEEAWKELAHLLHKKQLCHLVYKHSTSWKIKTLQRLALLKIQGHSKSEVRLMLKSCYIPHLTLWSRHLLEDKEMAGLLELLQPKDSLEIEELKELGILLEKEIQRSLKHLKALFFNRCPNVHLKNILETPAPFLRKLTLKGARFQPGDFEKLQMPKLCHLDLSESNLSPDHIIKMPLMPQVKTLNLYRCFNITTMAIELLKSKFPSLKELVLDNCISIYSTALAQLPSKISKLSLGWSSTLTTESFEKIQLEENQLLSFHSKNCVGFNDNALEIITQHSNLKSLHLDYCPELTSKGLELCLPHLKNLNDLSLKGLTLYTSTWQWLETLPLKRLQMPLWVNTPESLALPKLEHLDLSKSSNLSPKNFEYLLFQANLANLESFFVEDAHNMTDLLLPAITSWKKLKHLRIWSDIDTIQLFTEEGIKKLHSLKQLEHLELSHCGKFSLESLEELLCALSSLKTFEFGPLFKIGVQDVHEIQKRVPWVKITCYHYPEIPSL